MAGQFIDKVHGIDRTTAVANDSTGTRKIKDLPDAVGLAYDRVSNNFKYNDRGTIKRIPTVEAAMFTPTGAFTLLPEQSGLNILLNASAGFQITLPPPASGLTFRFIVAAAFATTNFTVLTSGGAHILYGGAITGNSDAPANGDNTISFVANAETPGDYVNMISDGVNWYCDGRSRDNVGITYTTV